MKFNILIQRGLLILTILLSYFGFSQDHYSVEQRDRWLKIAQDNTPKLIESIKKPTKIVEIVADPTAFQGYKAVAVGNVSSVYNKSFKAQSGIVLDFGEHLTGYFTFNINTINSVQDAPLRFKLTFGEVPAEVAVPFDPYPGGLSRAWLQDETVTVIELPAKIRIPRRLAFRYVKIEVLGSSPYFDFAINNLICTATTSAVNTPEALSAETPKLIADIDAVGLSTLKECMQTVFEDGPKRDRRLWIGDVYLQAQANTFSFKQHDLTKRCLYLLAGLAQPDGYLYCNVFESPTPHAQIGSPFLFDYALLYNALVKDYLTATGDKSTALDLWPVVKRQMQNITTHLDENNIFNIEKAQKNNWWLFVDWNDKLDRQASIQGVMIFSMKQTLDLAKLLGKEKEVAYLKPLVDKLSGAAIKHLFDKGKGVFVSGKNRQVSYASQAWMVLSGVVNKKDAQKVLKALENHKDAVTPGGPYLWHYYVQALLDSGLNDEAKKLVATYWGGMVQKGADTFWEVYDPKNEELSPYNFYPVNSYCHAWSCTPVYFIRKYPEVFQK